MPERWRRIDALLPLAAVVGGMFVVLLCHGSYFTTDDHVYFALDRDMPFGWRYLSEPAHDHFEPWQRLLAHVLQALGHEQWWLALAVSLLWYAAVLAAFAVLVRMLVGRHPVGFAVTAIFAVSPIFVQTGQWWALSAQLLPELAFLLLGLIAGVQWQRSGRRLWVGLALGAYALALCAFIKALLFAPLLVLVLYLRPDPPGSLDTLRQRLGPAWRRDRLLWLGVVAITLVYLAIIGGDRYYRFISNTPDPGAGDWVKFLIAAWTEGVAPLALAGTVPSALGAGNALVLVAANLIVLAVVGASVRRRRATAWTWGGALLVVLAGIVMAGVARLEPGVIEKVALDPRYNAEGALTLLLAAALTARAAWPQPRATRGAVLLATGMGGVVVALALDAGLRLEQTWRGREHRSYLETFVATYRPGIDIVDGPVAANIVPPQLHPYDLYSKVLPNRLPEVRVGTGTGTPATLDYGGRVTPVRLRPVPSARSADCTPLELRVDLPRRPDVTVITLARRDVERATDLVLTTDTGLPGGQVLGGFKLPAVTTAAYRLGAGRRTLRAQAGLGAARTIRITAPAGPAVCLSSVQVSRFPVPTG